LTQEPTNWLTGYSYRKRHLINGSTSVQTNYNIELTVYKGSGTDSGSSVYLSQNCRDDFADVRFTQEDGETELSYWIERVNFGTSAQFWVKIPSLATTQTEIYIYYDNSALIVAPDENMTWTYPAIRSTNYKITTGGAGEWDVTSCEQGCLVKNSDDNKYYLFYEARNTSGYYAIGYATSTTIDGTYTKSPNNPVIERNVTALQGYGQPNLIFENGYWYMFTGHQDGGTGSWESIRLWRASSLTDNSALSWESLGDVIERNSTLGAWDYLLADPNVIKDGSTYRMVFEGFESGLTNFQLGVATSNSIDSGWTKYSGNPVLSPDSNQWYATGLSNPSLVKEGDVFYALHCGECVSGSYGALELATSTDFFSWTIKKPLGRNGSLFGWRHTPSIKMSPHLYEDENNHWYLIYQEGVAYMFILRGFQQGDPVSTFPLFDHFSAPPLLSVWSNVSVGWNLTNHMGTFRIVEGADYDETIRSSTQYKNFTLKLKYWAKAYGDRVSPSIYLRANSTLQDGYLVELPMITGKAVFYKRESGVLTLINDTQSYGSVSYDTWYTARFVVNNQTLSLTEWNNSALTPAINITDSTFQDANYIGFRGNNSRTIIEWILVTEYADPEPVHDIWDLQTELIDLNHMILVQTNGTLDSANWIGDAVVLTVDATGVSETEVYCGTKGAPQKVFAKYLKSWEYNVGTAILTIQLEHQSLAQVTVSWAVSASGLYYLDVYVRHDGLPYYEAEVSVDGVGQNTDIFGKARFTLTTGEYFVTATIGEETQNKTVNLTDDRAVGFDFWSGKGSPSHIGDIILVIGVCLILGFFIIPMLARRRR